MAKPTISNMGDILQLGREVMWPRGSFVTLGRLTPRRLESIEMLQGRSPRPMKALLTALSNRAGKHGVVEAVVLDTNANQDAAMLNYLVGSEAKNSNPNRKHYGPLSYNCGTLVCESLDAARRPSPAVRTMQTPGNIFGEFLASPWQYGVTQTFIYTPPTEKVTSKICYQNDADKSVCQSSEDHMFTIRPAVTLAALLMTCFIPRIRLLSKVPSRKTTGRPQRKQCGLAESMVVGGCSVWSVALDYNECTIFDEEGRTQGPERYVLKSSGRPARPEQLKYTYLTGKAIGLQGGLELTRVDADRR